MFLFLLKNIDCGYSLEPPRQGGSKEYPQSMLWAEIWKISKFLSENFHFFSWKKFSVYLNRLVLVMIWPSPVIHRPSVWGRADEVRIIDWLRHFVGRKLQLKPVLLSRNLALNSDNAHSSTSSVNIQDVSNDLLMTTQGRWVIDNLNYKLIGVLFWVLFSSNTCHACSDKEWGSLYMVLTMSDYGPSRHIDVELALFQRCVPAGECVIVCTQNIQASIFFLVNVPSRL